MWMHNTERMLLKYSLFDETNTDIMKNYEAILLILIDAIISEIMKNYVAEIMFHMESSITNIFENYVAEVLRCFT